MAKDKYCVLPGQKPVRIASISGHVVIIGEEPREIPDIFVHEARAAGCHTEANIADLKSRLFEGGAVQGNSSQDASLGTGQGQLSLTGQVEGGKGPDKSEAEKKFEEIKAATIEILNTGNPDDMTGNGKPKVETLESKLGYQVSGPERDAAFDAVEAEMQP